MKNRFVDNETRLNAETLNQLENEVSYKVCHAVFEEYDQYKVKVYRVTDTEWSDIPVGAVFSVIFDQSTKGSNNSIIGLLFGSEKSAKYLFYGVPDSEITLKSTQYVRESERKYLSAGRPYVMKKVIEHNQSVPMIVMLDRFDTSSFAATMDTSGDSLVLKNLDGDAISAVDLQPIIQKISGTATYTVSGNTLNITTK